MSIVEFIHNNFSTIIQCDQDEKMEEIINKFINKTKLDKNQIFFLYNGDKIDINLSFNQLINEVDKKGKKMKILVSSLNDSESNSSKIKSHEIICPKCGENALINIEDYRIKLSGCKNGHNTENILLNKYDETQYIDLSKIKCDSCKEKNKANSYKNKFFLCFTCNMNLCPLCQSSHDDSHNIINDTQKNYICNIHNIGYSSYCDTCKMNLCYFCENDHENHKIIYFKEITTFIKMLKKKEKELREKIDKLNNDINIIIDNLNNVKQNFAKYYNIINDYINSFKLEKLNYNILNNIKEFNKNNIYQDIDKIINENDINKKINKIFNIYYKMNNINNPNIIDENNKEIIIPKKKYEINNDKNKEVITEEEIQKIYDHFEDLYFISSFIEEDEIREIIRKYNGNEQKIQQFIVCKV